MGKSAAQPGQSASSHDDRRGEEIHDQGRSSCQGRRGVNCGPVRAVEPIAWTLGHTAGWWTDWTAPPGCTSPSRWASLRCSCNHAQAAVGSPCGSLHSTTQQVQQQSSVQRDVLNPDLEHKCRVGCHGKLSHVGGVEPNYCERGWASGTLTYRWYVRCTRYAAGAQTHRR